MYLLHTKEEEMPSRVLFIVLDAFRSDYINPVDTPFLYSKISTGVYVEKLKSTAGFTQRTALYTGTAGSESGMFTMYTFDAKNSPFAFLRNHPRFVQFSARSHWWNKLPPWRGLTVIKRLMDRRFKEHVQGFRGWIQQQATKHANHAPVANIPVWLLPEIGVSEDNRPIHLPGAFDQETIFDVLVREGIEYEYFMYPVVDGQDEAVLEAFLTHKDSNTKILMGQFSDSDQLIHHCGPSSPKRKQITGEIDRKLREIAAHYDADTVWIILGDHGMTDVVEELDIPALLEPLERRHNVRMGRDYLLFLDSTMARFRWITETGKEFLREVAQSLTLSGKGRFVDEQIAKEHSIPVVDRRYGDLIWWANIGVLLFPDYFHDEDTHNKGMHGYDSDHDDMKGFFLAFGSGIEPRRVDQANLIDVCPTICAAVGAPVTRSNRGICLLK